MADCVTNPSLGEPNEFIRKNMRLVYFVVQRFHRYIDVTQVYDENDFVSVGTYALFKAYQTFDTSRGTKFSTWAVWMISGACRNFTRNIRRETKKQTMSFDDVMATDKIGHTLAVEDTLVGDVFDETSTIVRDYIDTLSPRDQQVLEMRMSGMKQHEIAAELDISQVHVSRLLRDIARRYQVSEWQHVS